MKWDFTTSTIVLTIVVAIAAILVYIASREK